MRRGTRSIYHGVVIIEEAGEHTWTRVSQGKTTSQVKGIIAEHSLRNKIIPDKIKQILFWIPLSFVLF